MSKEIIAQQDRRLVTPFGIDGRGMAPDHRFVEDVVVHERRRVDHFNDGRQNGMSVGERAARLSREKDQRRPQPFAR